MVEQSKAGANTEIQYSPTGFVMQLMNGQTWVKEFVPMPGGTEEVWQSSGASPYYRHADWLGSSRFASTYSTRAMYNDLAYAPFGEQYAQSGSTGVTDTSFAGNDENTVTNLYDAQFREYGIQGRWPSPDPSGIKAVDPRNPQSWNRYAYALNNPLRAIDPSGLDCVYLDDVGDDVEWIDPNSNPDECGGGGGYWIPGTVDPDSIVIDSDNGWIEATSNTGLGTFASGCQGAGCGNDPNGFSYSASTFSNSAFAQPGQGVSAWYNADPNTGQSTGVAGLSSYQQYFNSMNQDQWNATQFGNFFNQPFMDLNEGCQALAAAGVVGAVAPAPPGAAAKIINIGAAVLGWGCS